VLWGDVLVDGHNRYGICQKHGIPFQTLQSSLFKSMEDVHLWMIDQHLGRRSVSDFQRGVLALRKREILNDRRLKAEPAVAPDGALPATETVVSSTPASVVPTESMKSREDIAKAARLSSSQVVLIEKIQKQATPEVVAAIKSGTLSLNAAAAVASLPEEEQIAAAQGGKEQLRQAAKRVRDSKKRPATDESHDTAAPESVEALKARITELEMENTKLRAQLAALLG
jgi:hypothetical protein